MDILTQIILLMIMLELLEANFQKAPTLALMMERLYDYYQKSVFFFFLIHPTFYFVLFVSLYFNLFNGYILTILIVKSLDILFKIEIIQQRFIRQEMDEELRMIMQMKIAPWMSLIGIMMYVPLLFLALYK